MGGEGLGVNRGSVGCLCLPTYQLSRAAELPEQAKRVAEKELKVDSH